VEPVLSGQAIDPDPAVGGTHHAQHRCLAHIDPVTQRTVLPEVGNPHRDQRRLRWDSLASVPVDQHVGVGEQIVGVVGRRAALSGVENSNSPARSGSGRPPGKRPHRRSGSPKESGRSELQLACEAVSAALDDAGLSPGEVDDMVTFTMDSSDEIEVARNVGIGDLTFFSRVPHGGGAAAGTVAHSAMAVAAGVADVAVCYRAFNERSGMRFGGSGRTTAETPLFMAHYAASDCSRPQRGWPCTRSATCRPTASATRTSAGSPSSTGPMPPGTPKRGSISVRSPWKITRIRGGSSNPCCDCWIAASRATAGSRQLRAPPRTAR